MQIFLFIFFCLLQNLKLLAYYVNMNAMNIHFTKHTRTSFNVSEVTETPTTDPFIADKSFNPYFTSSTSSTGL